MIKIRSVRDILRLYFIFQKEFKWAFCSTLVLAILGAFLLPSRFESEARLLVKPGRENSTIPIEFGDRPTLVSPSTQRDPILDEEKQLTGHSVAKKVAEFYLGQEVPPPVGWWKQLKFKLKKSVGEVIDSLRHVLVKVGLTEEQDEVDRLVTKLQKQLSVTHVAGSSVIEVSFVWDDPYVAQKVVDKWVSTYLDERTHILGRKSLYEFYENESQRIALQIAENKKKISEYLKTIDGVGSKERLETLTKQIDRMASERSEANTELIGLDRGVASAGNEVKQLPKEVIREREISLNPNRQDLMVKLNDLEIQRMEKLKVYQDNAPPIKELDNSILLLKEKIASENSVLQTSENRTPNDLVTGLKRNILERSTRMSELKARIASYDKELESLKSEREKLLSIEPELSRLERDLSVDEKSYALYLDSLEKARIDRELDNSRISNIAIVEPATFVPGRVFPKSIPILLAAVPASFAVGLFVLYLCFLLDQRIHDGDLIEERFGVPVWTTVMEVESGDEAKKLPPVFEASIYRLYSMLPLDKLMASGLNIGISSARRKEGVSFVVHHFMRILSERDIPVRLAENSADRANPGEVLLIKAADLVNDHQALFLLKNADIRLLLVEARVSTVPVVEHALSVLNIAFRHVDGIIVNKRRFEVPAKWMKKLTVWKGST